MKRINNIIKSAALGLTGLMFFSCSDFLEIEPLNEIVLEKFWNEESDVENIVAGCYSAMQSQTIIDRMMAWGEFRSDNIIGGTKVEDDVNLSNIFKENINASNGYTNWGEFYEIINRCNTVLYYAPSVAEKDPNYTESELNATRAEVSAIRDLCYFYLIRAFRDVPYTTQPYLDDTQQMDQPATKFNDVLDSLILDLESVRTYAVKKYPETSTYYQHGRITQNAIHSMLCEMYLWKQDYANAVKYADMVIDAMTDDYQKDLDKAGSSLSSSDKMIDGFPLISDQSTSAGSGYGNAYNEIFGTGDSRESIFELIFMNNDNMLANYSVSYRYGNITTFPGNVKAAAFVGADPENDVNPVFLSKYDTRYYENLNVLSTSNIGIAKYAVRSVTVNTTSSTITTTRGGYWPEKYCHANWILYRLTDVMLMKAEALVQMVNTEDTTAVGKENNDSLLHQAFTIVNAVNKRSNCSTSSQDLTYSAYSSKSLMANLVLDERQRELMFEGKRWFDLVRRSRRDGNTNYLINQVTRKGSDNASVVQSKLAKMDAIYWPYNINELKVNSNLVQNPAFGSGEEDSYKNSSK